MMELTQSLTEAFARMPLAYLRQEYPSQLVHLMLDDGDALPPRKLHPVFYGCYDWHSAVHGYWLLLRCLSIYPELSCRDDIVTLFNAYFTEENIAQERAYFTAPSRTAFERPYGYGWLLSLSLALKQSALPQASQWYRILEPLTHMLRDRFIDYFTRLTYAIRVDTHTNSAFALMAGLDYARAMDDSELERVIVDTAKRFYGRDVGYPAHYEPGGDEYLSGALTEAMLMSKISPDFTRWFDRFLPDVSNLSTLLRPAEVSDRTDPAITHLDGLNLSRAWCFKHIAAALPGDHPAITLFQDAAVRHVSVSLPHVVGSHYSGGHWLASFAFLALEQNESILGASFSVSENLAEKLGEKVYKST